MTTLQKTTRVLVVDDEADYAMSMALLLKKHGYESHMCFDSMGCIDLVERLRPHVVLLDLAMPGLSGLDIAKKIRGTPELSQTCLIAVTGRGQNLDRVQTKLCGFDHHLLKPVDFQQLNAIVRSVVH
jgi:two-component system, OmpR family, response regulator